MDLWVKITNTVTVGNIGAFVFLLSTIILGYYKIRRLIAQKHVEYLAYVATLTENQTKRIEDCIHKLPNHPESIAVTPAAPAAPAGPAGPAIIVSDIPGG